MGRQKRQGAARPSATRPNERPDPRQNPGAGKKPAGRQRTTHQNQPESPGGPGQKIQHRGIHPGAHR